MSEQEREKEKKKEKKKVIVLEIVMLGRRVQIEVLPGTKLSDALREANIDLKDVAREMGVTIHGVLVRLNGKALKINDDGSIEDPALWEDAVLILIKKIKGGSP